MRFFFFFLQLVGAFWQTAVQHINRLDKKGMLDVDINDDPDAKPVAPGSAGRAKNGRIVLSVFSSQEEFEEHARQKSLSLRKVLGGSMTVLIIAKMFSMELNYVSTRYFDEDTRLDARSSINSLITVVSSQLTDMLAGRAEAFIESCVVRTLCCVDDHLHCWFAVVPGEFESDQCGYHVTT